MKFYLPKSITISVMRHFFEDVVNRAAALSFTTLLALVPLMIVCLSTLSAFPFFTSSALDGANFTKILTPLQVKLYKAIFNLCGTIRICQSGTFVHTVFTVFTIEQALNVIWRAPQTRRHIALFLYAIILCGAPALIAMSI